MGYIFDIRKKLGHDPIILTGAGVILVNEKNEILLGKRTDNGYWAYPAGSMELGESFEECARRETLEETGLLCGKLDLLMIRSGKDTYYEYPNQDKVYFAGVVYICFEFSGEMRVQEEEVVEQAFFPIDSLPDNMSPGTVEIIEKTKEYLSQLTESNT
ncbi:MAG: NUDIX hydrolase [Clostridiales bacterium]|nr:NUDIX hydrolase [Clostridiales bacterium]